MWCRITGVLLIFSIAAHSQDISQKYWIYFRDKDNNPYILDKPEAFLSKKSIERRKKQRIVIDETDLPISPKYLNAIESLGVTVIHKSKWLNAISIKISESPLLDQIANYSFVKEIEIVKTEKRPIEDTYQRELLKSDTYPISNEYEYGSGYDQIAMLNGHHLHDFGFRGEGITIAVLDAGFKDANTMQVFDHLRSEGRIKGCWDFVDDDEDVYEISRHGTSVFSIMGAALPGLFTGTAPGADYWLLRTENTNSELIIEEDNWVAGAEFADSIGADIINSSLGYHDFDDSTTDHTYSDMDGNTTIVTKGADMAARKGILVVNSAGNEGVSWWKHVLAPADGDSVLTVGAVDIDRNYANFSSKGPTYDGRIKPNVSALGLNTSFANQYGTTSKSSGTSLASPLIAGLAACLWQAHPESSNMDILDIIEESAHQYNYPDTMVGYGIPDFLTAHFLLLKKHESPMLKNGFPLIFPNPFENYLFLVNNLSENQDFKLQIFNAMGQLVYINEGKMGGNGYQLITIDISTIQGYGWYFVNLITPSGENVFKVLKM